MAFLPCKLQLLSVDTGSAAAPALTTKTWSLACPVNDARGMKAASVLTLAQSGGASSPAAGVVLELSPDNVRWFPTDLSASTTTEAPTASDMTADTDVLRYARVRLTATGGTRPAVSCDVYILSEVTLIATALD